MARAPSPEDIYDSARVEGERRLSMSALEQASTGFIAGVTIVFGIVALGMTRELVAPTYASGVGQLVGAVAFGIGLVFVVIGRTELFTENFFDPVAAALARRRLAAVWQLARLWILVLLLNLVGGAVMAAVFSVEGTLPSGAHHTLALVAEEIAAREGFATVTRGIAAGTLLTLLSYLLHAVGSAGSRIALAWLVGFFLALGPFDHVVVSGLHLLFGVWLGAHVSYVDLGLNLLLAGTGNLLGGLLLMTLTHAVQVRGS
ncbi:formate/nitrite transporter family protein [Micromonospora sp. KC606]|uniref:formate/nitrite transporter family protein n=1 Tax=Micromonospora sp. KC606 TaxID=2530379 RepID=UPI001044A5A7|nr:formate/nitrite transporter family protein [Micromonospora sp. KC606]TDC84236.1 formate/nitrite transporter family protein [Micromonospora sp. KC606]